MCFFPQLHRGQIWRSVTELLVLHEICTVQVLNSQRFHTVFNIQFNVAAGKVQQFVFSIGLVSQEVHLVGFLKHEGNLYWEVQ